MLAYLKERTTAVFAWLYQWVTVLTGIAMAIVSVIPSLIANFNLVDLTPFVGAERAAQIVTGVALLKGFIEAVRAAKKTAG